MLLAIETSCDETAIALLELDFDPDAQGNIASRLCHEALSSQVSLHLPYGGVVPELASREHVRNLPLLVEAGLAEVNKTVADIEAIAVTRGPGLKGCLLVGLSYAKALAQTIGKPLLALHHLEGHIFASFLTTEREQPEYPFIALIVSGGHTQLVVVEAFRNYKTIASTRDDAAGEAFDKAATLLGLPYPGGPAVSAMAEKGDPLAYSLPIGMKGVPDSFSFSGLKTALARIVNDLGDTAREPQTSANLCASFQNAVVTSLCEKSLLACNSYSPKSFVLTGGVAANSELRARLSEEISNIGISFCCPERKWCTDNAAMMAVLAQYVIAQAPEVFSGWNPKANSEKLGPGVGIDVGAVSRWPLEDLCSSDGC